MAFRGTYEHSLDAKNRLTIPSKFRDDLEGGVVLAKGIEPCVSVWTPGAFDRHLEGSLHGLHRGGTRYRTLRRFLEANAFPTSLDGAGRVMVPPPLMQHARLHKDVIVAGAGDLLELWDRATWTSHESDLLAQVIEISDSLGHPAA